MYTDENSFHRYFLDLSVTASAIHTPVFTRGGFCSLYSEVLQSSGLASSTSSSQIRRSNAGT